MELFDYDTPPFPTEGATKYGDVTKEALKKQCKKVYKYLNFDPWNEAIRYKRVDEDLLDYVLEYPDPCKIKFEFEGFSGCIYPLSMCYALHASEDTIEAVYDSYQPAIKETDYWIGTPYHYAAAYGSPVEIVKFLIQKDPKGVEVVNYFGRTALHMGAMWQAPKASMEVLCDKYPKAAQIKDRDGYTPLHIACEHGAEWEIIELLINAYPPATHAPAQFEMLPIHYATSQNQSMRVIQCILDSCEDPSAMCLVTDMLGHTPLHMALMGLAPVHVIQCLVDACPESVWQKTNKGELPLEIGQRKRAPADVLQLLEKKMEEILLAGG